MASLRALTDTGQTTAKSLQRAPPLTLILSKDGDFVLRMCVSGCVCASCLSVFVVSVWVLARVQTHRLD